MPVYGVRCTDHECKLKCGVERVFKFTLSVSWFAIRRHHRSSLVVKYIRRYFCVEFIDAKVTIHLKATRYDKIHLPETYLYAIIHINVCVCLSHGEWATFIRSLLFRNRFTNHSNHCHAVNRHFRAKKKNIVNYLTLYSHVHLEWLAWNSL